MASSTTHLDTISSTQAQKEVTANALYDAASHATAWGRRASTTAALTWGYYGGTEWEAGSLTVRANGTLTLTNNATNYIEKAPGAAPSVNTSAFTAGSKRLYTVVTSGGVVTSYTDHRTISFGASIDALARLTSAADKLPYFSGSGSASLADFTTFGRSLVDDADASAARTTLGLGTIATQAANNVAITGGAIDGTTIGGTTAAAITGTTITANTEFRGTVLTSNAASDVSIKSSGGEQVRALHVASAVNYSTLSGSATGAAIASSVAGSDTNISRNFITKGTGTISFLTNSTVEQFRVVHMASAVNYFSAQGATTGSAPGFSAGGSDAAVQLLFLTKGGSIHNFMTSGGTQFVVQHKASAVNYGMVQGGATGAGITYSAQGTDANIDFIAAPKGSGQFDISGTAATTAGTPASFSANRYLAIKVNGTSYYLPLATATW